MSTPTDPTAGEGLSEAVQAGLRKCRVEDGAPVGLFREDDLFHISHMVTAEIERIVAARESAAAARARAEVREQIAQAIESRRPHTHIATNEDECDDGCGWLAYAARIARAAAPDTAGESA